MHQWKNAHDFKKKCNYQILDKKKSKYTVGNSTQTILFYNVKRILKNNEVKKIVKEAFDKSRSAGYKKIRTKVAARYTGLSNKKILQITKG